MEGRTYKCVCGKAYLSQPALTNHKKAKHSIDNIKQINNDPDKIKKRGRPAKQKVDIQNMFVEDKFFEKENRKNMDEEIDINKHFKSSFEDIYIKNSEFCYNKFKDESQHNLFTLLLSTDTSKLTDNIKDTETKSIDEAFSHFILTSKNKTNKEFFSFLLKFIFIFLECINKTKESNQFSMSSAAQTIPEFSNLFFLYLYDSNFFGMDSDEDKLEMMDMMIYLCNWLRLYQFTNLKIQIVSK